MKKTLLPAFYLPPVSWFTVFLQQDSEIAIEQFEHFPKQTYRNRANIYGANGKLSLIIPIHHNGKRVMNEIEVSDVENWRALHWKSIKNAYQSSPYFEFYEGQLKRIFETDEQSLLLFNLNALKILLSILKIEKEYILNTEYSAIFEGDDYRNHFSAKKPETLNLEPYYQTFSDKLGFIEDLSIIDLICNKGPESLTYLKHNSTKLV